jgi:hypothetical protein
MVAARNTLVAVCCGFAGFSPDAVLPCGQGLERSGGDPPYAGRARSATSCAASMYALERLAATDGEHALTERMNPAILRVP